MLCSPCLYETGWEDRNLLVWVKNNGAGALFAQIKALVRTLLLCLQERPRTPLAWPNQPTHGVGVPDKPLANELHPTMKPLALIESEPAICNATEPGQLIVDAFPRFGHRARAAAAQRLALLRV